MDAMIIVWYFRGDDIFHKNKGSRVKPFGVGSNFGHPTQEMNIEPIEIIDPHCFVETIKFLLSTFKFQAVKGCGITYRHFPPSKRSIPIAL